MVDHKQHHLGMTSILVTLPVQLMVQVPGLKTGNLVPLTVSFLMAVPLKQFISSLSISMYSSMAEIVHALVLPPEETLSVTTGFDAWNKAFWRTEKIGR